MASATMTQYRTGRHAASPAAPNDRDSLAAKRAPRIDLERVVWDQEYRDEVIEALKAGG